MDRQSFSQSAHRKSQPAFFDIMRCSIIQHRKLVSDHPFSCLLLDVARTSSKEAALQRLHGRHISTFVLIDDDEFREGVARAERDLPEVITSHQEMFFISADKLA